MGIRIPEGEYAVPRSSVNLLNGPRVTRFFYTWVRKELDGTELPMFGVEGVVPGGSLEWSASASVKGKGRVQIQDIGQDVDWLNWRLKIETEIEGPNGDVLRQPLGVWIPSAPTETRVGDRIVRDVELLDKSTVLDQDLMGDPLTGEVFSYSLPVGTNIVEAVRSVISGAGEKWSNIQDSPKTLTTPMTWTIGTTRLKIVNDLLSAGGFFALWVDLNGEFRVTPYQSPIDRPVSFAEVQAFTDTEDMGLLSPDWTREVDVWAIPNRVVAIQQGSSEDKPPLVAVALNQDINSPFSFQSRGRYVTTVYDQVEAADQAALQAYADSRLNALSQLAEKVDVSHLLVPGLRVNQVVEFSVDTVRGLYTVQNTTVPLSYNGMCSSALSAVRNSLSGDPEGDVVT